MSDYTRDDLRVLTPDRYLAQGYTDETGEPRPELTQLWATAASTQLLDAELSPQELGFTLAAAQLLWPQHDEPDPRTRLNATIEEALFTVARAIQQPNNTGLYQWLNQCTPPVQTDADARAFFLHFEAVNRQYSLVAGLQPPDSVAA